MSTRRKYMAARMHLGPAVVLELSVDDDHAWACLPYLPVLHEEACVQKEDDELLLEPT